jgi:hypothetical protein
MAPGSLPSNFPDRPSPLVPFAKATNEIEEAGMSNHGPMAPRMFANAAQEYFDKYGASIEHLADIGIFYHFPNVDAFNIHRISRKEPFTFCQQPILTVSCGVDEGTNFILAEDFGAIDQADVQSHQRMSHMISVLLNGSALTGWR